MSDFNKPKQFEGFEPKTCGNCGWWMSGDLHGCNFLPIPMVYESHSASEIDGDKLTKDTDASDCECWKEIQ